MLQKLSVFLKGLGRLKTGSGRFDCGLHIGVGWAWTGLGQVLDRSGASLWDRFGSGFG